MTRELDIEYPNGYTLCSEASPEASSEASPEARPLNVMGYDLSSEDANRSSYPGAYGSFGSETTSSERI